MTDVYLSLGTNIGEREQNLKKAVALLRQKKGIRIQAVSSIYETAPIGLVEQPSFLNICLYVTTDASPYEMLEICQSIENELGRVREIRWGPRIIDLDILLYNQETIVADHLIIPHPRMYERAFVLVPLMEIANKPYGEKLQHAERVLKALDLDKEGVTLWRPINSVEEFILD